MKHTSIVEDKETYRAWLYNKEYGIKSLMFGVKKTSNKKEDFKSIVEKTTPIEIETYKYEWVD